MDYESWKKNKRRRDFGLKGILLTDMVNLIGRC